MTSPYTAVNEVRTTHTPGPWRVGCEGWSLWRAEYDGDADVSSHQPISSSTGEVVCLIVGVGDSDEQFDANARLIAAAPDMLKSLHDIRDAGLGGYLTPELCADIVTRAIASAESSS